MTHTSSGSLFMVVAPSGAGKSTLVNALLAQEPAIKLSISYTTRNPRPAEQHGREYYFTTVEDFLARRESGEFLESAEVHGNYYGTSRLLIEADMKAGRDVLLEIDWQGAQQEKTVPASSRYFHPAAVDRRIGRAPEETRAGRTKRNRTPSAGRRR